VCAGAAEIEPIHHVPPERRATIASVSGAPASSRVSSQAVGTSVRTWLASGWLA
jgi:hypothetical protein